MAKLRTIKQIYSEIRRADPDSCISESFIRKAVKNGDIKAIKVGKRSYLSLEAVEQYIKERVEHGTD